MAVILLKQTASITAACISFIRKKKKIEKNILVVTEWQWKSESFSVFAFAVAVAVAVTIAFPVFAMMLLSLSLNDENGAFCKSAVLL